MKGIIRRTDGTIFAELEGTTQEFQFLLLGGEEEGREAPKCAESSMASEDLSHKNSHVNTLPQFRMKKRMCRKCGTHPVEPGKGHRFCTRCSRKGKPRDKSPVKEEDFEGETCVMCGKPVNDDDDIECINGRNIHAKCAVKIKKSEDD
jgi:hypothetical protein